jgi:hypothetical protein
MAVRVTGIDKVMRNLSKELKKVKRLSMKGLIKAAALIKADMDRTPPKIPVDLNNLRSSGYIVSTLSVDDAGGSFKGPNSGAMASDHASAVSSAKAKSATMPGGGVAIGFSASYAAHVENDTTTKRNRAGSGGKFFESSIKRNTPHVIKIVQKEARIR